MQKTDNGAENDMNVSRGPLKVMDVAITHMLRNAL